MGPPDPPDDTTGFDADSAVTRAAPVSVPAGGVGLDQPLAAGDRLGEFQLLRVIGAGGMGMVYEARQLNPSRRVAIKVIRGGAVVDEVGLRMFAREIESLARLKHPNIATIHASGRTDGGHHYFAMELVQGRTLDHYLRETTPAGPLSRAEIERRIRIVMALCGAVAYAHQRGVIHRDLKPGNVMITDDTSSSSSRTVRPAGGELKVLDFGLARITDADIRATQVTEVSAIMGTLAYMSPEQAAGRSSELDLRTDVYSLGVLFYECLTGSRPLDFSGTSFIDALRILAQTPPRPLAAAWPGQRAPDSDLETIVAKALAKEPSERYQSADALATDLARYLAGQPILARPASGWYHVRKLAGRHRVETGALVVVLLLLATLAVTMTVQARRVAAARDVAATEASRAKAINRFMFEMLSAADPWRGEGVRDVTVAEALEGVGRRLDESFRDEPEVRADVLATLATTNSSLGRALEADSLARAALALRQRVLKQSGIQLATAFAQVAGYAKEAGRPGEADSLFLEALALVREARRRGVSPAEADSAEMEFTINRATTLNALGRYAESDSLGRAAVALSRRLFGPDTIHEAAALSARDGAASGLNRMALADSIARQELRIRRLRDGEMHPETLAALNNVATATMLRGGHAEAESLFDVVLPRMREVMGPDHPSTVRAIENRAHVMFRTKRYSEAAAALREVIDIRRRVLGPNSMPVFRSLSNMGLLYARAGEPDSSMVSFNQAIPGFEAAAGPDHPELAIMLAGRGQAAMDLGRSGEAESDFRRALDIRRRVLPDDNLVLAASRINLGELLVSRRRWAEADSLLVRGIEVRAATNPTGDTMLQRGRKALETLRTARRR